MNHTGARAAADLDRDDAVKEQMWVRKFVFENVWFLFNSFILHGGSQNMCSVFSCPFLLFTNDWPTDALQNFYFFCPTLPAELEATAAEQEALVPIKCNSNLP